MKKFFIFYFIIIFLVFAIHYTNAEKIVNNNQTNEVTVTIKGMVAKPNIYKVPNTYLNIDVVNLAIPLPEANLTNKNLFKRVKNNTVITVYKKDTFRIININTASKIELTSLDGVGEKTAEKIILYREKNKFKTIEELKNVSKAAYEKNKNRITV